MATIEPPFSQGTGYSLLIGVGLAFGGGMSLVSLGLKRYFAEIQTSEMFMTAGHAVKTGLIASAVVSSWTIASTLLTSTTYGYLYGVSGPYWYGAGASIQILLFSVAAIELKRKAPNAHTFLELARVRYGAAGHLTLTSYSVTIQVLQSVNLLVGGSGAFAFLTGINRDAACFLFPISVVIYTWFGGIKATIITDWAHTIIIYGIMMSAIFIVYTTSDLIGSPSRMWELLTEAAVSRPVTGNAEGSFLTMRSEDGGYIGLIFLGAGFAAVVDSQLWQKAIAADPAGTLGGYLLGGSCWFTIPFVLATTFGLAAVVTEGMPSFPTYPNRMNADEITNGMAMPYAALAVMGRGGAIGVLLMIFMAVASAMSSETVAHSALVTYDIYQAYINPNATGKQLLRVSQSVVVGFCIVIPTIAVGFNHAGFSTNWLVTATGIFVDSAIVPMFCTIMWKKQSKAAVILAPIISSAAGMIAWLTLAYTMYGEVTIATTSTNLPLVAGNMMSLTGPIVLTPLFSYIFPTEDFDWEIFKNIRKANDADIGHATMAEGEEEQEGHQHHDDPITDEKRLLRARKVALIASSVLTLIYLILWPIPMYGTSYVFSRNFFTGWIVIVFLWGFYATITITMLPLWEGRRSIASFTKFILFKKKPVLEGSAPPQEENGEERGHGQPEEVVMGEKKESGSGGGSVQEKS